MQPNELNAIKELMKEVSACITELKSSLVMFVEDMKDPEQREAFKEQVRSAEKLANKLDEAILAIALTQKQAG